MESVAEKLLVKLENVVEDRASTRFRLFPDGHLKRCNDDAAVSPAECRTGRGGVPKAITAIERT